MLLKKTSPELRSLLSAIDSLLVEADRLELPLGVAESLDLAAARLAAHSGICREAELKIEPADCFPR